MTCYLEGLLGPLSSVLADLICPTLRGFQGIGLHVQPSANRRGKRAPLKVIANRFVPPQCLSVEDLQPKKRAKGVLANASFNSA